MISKIIAIFLALFVISHALEVPPALKKQVKKLHIRCANQTGVAEEVLRKAHQAGQLPSDPAFKCFLYCMLEIFGLIDSENIMHLESLIEVLPEDVHAQIQRLADACGTKKGADGCETAYLTVKCYIETDGPFIKGAVDDLLG
ncbi:general odorant-binding protein 69a [Drosophila tropicalis]|uniref:general odorant-binding protein 69a n=1 Tax=Drosophila tropicalis TaxID=46794 RepID=UPI0035AC2234